MELPTAGATMSPDAQWLNTEIQLIRRAAESMPGHDGGKRRLASAQPDPERGSGWYLVIGRVRPADYDSIGDSDLRDGSSGDAILYDVLEVAVEGEQVRVRASANAPGKKLDLYVPSVSQRLILSGLADGLAAVRDNPLLRSIAARSLTPFQPGSDLQQVHAWAALKAAQKEAVGACCAPGLQLIWGPPGTGKTHVIASSIAHLAAAGRRVLLVSSTNVAVDTALHQAIRVLDPRDGQVVRVGAIHLPALAAKGGVNLDQLAEARQAALQRQLAALEARLDQLAETSEQVTACEARLTGFDQATYALAARRVRNRKIFDQHRSDLGTARAENSKAQADKETAERRLLVLDYREALVREAAIRRDLASVRDQLAGLESQSWLARRRSGVSHLRASQARLVSELADAGTAVRGTGDKVRRANADPDSYGELNRADVSAALEMAEQRLTATGTRIQDLMVAITGITKSGLSSPADAAQVTNQRELWGLHTALLGLREQAKRNELERARVAAEHEKLQKEMIKEKRKLQKAIVSRALVVGTTLTQIALRSWITEQPFDYVIVDEAAAAPFPHLIHAVGRARVGAVLVGDYLQNGPIVEGFPQGEVLQRFFKQEVFGYFGATEPSRSAALPGCVVLTEQFRFGPTLTELANRVAYDGVLVTAGAGSAEIVVVTVDGLPENLRWIDRGSRKEAGWWPIGALLARALAEHHHDGGSVEAFGVVVPYGAQKEATEAALGADLGHIPVGTSHGFQGRQFTTVLADLVEDGKGWVAKAGRHGGPHALDGLRLFNVAATRPRGRLYVLLTHAALASVRSGPLAALRAMTDSGAAHLVDAGQLLGLSYGERPLDGTPEADLLQALDPYVRVAGVHDEDAAIGEVVACIGEAERSLWCWSAWVGKHSPGIVDALERASQRGVEVHVVARPGREVQGSNRKSLEALTERLPHVVFMRDMHQKLVIVDRQWSILGSMNMLSHGKTSSSRLRDIMVTVKGPRFAEYLLAHENAAELAQRRQCRVCRQPLTECGKVDRERRWAWLCASRDADGESHPPLPFPEAPVSGSRRGSGRTSR
jgi:AAA domain/PLD-like domain